MSTEDGRGQAAPPPVEHGARGEVVRVVDGDTLHVRTGSGRRLKVRIKGIDCPESRPNSKCRAQGRRGGPDCEEQMPLGKAATGYARRLIDDTPVVLEGVGEETLETDRYGRYLAYVRMGDGRDFGLVMIRDTHCRDYSHKYPHPRSDVYLRVQE